MDDQTPHEIERLERNLIQTMIQLIVRDPDGMLRIETALHSVREAGAEMCEG